MRLNREQYGTMAEVTARARRMYRQALKASTNGIIRDEELAEMYVDSQVAAQFVAILWRQSGDEARHAQSTRLDTATSQPTPELQASEDDPPADV